MADGGDKQEWRLTEAEGLSQVGRAEWNAIANPPGAPYDPFLDWDFLEAAEQTGCAQTATGWTPRHILARSPDGTLQGAAPLYLKTHSRGEFVFDHGWADAFERAGGRYYPKLLCAVPFTPVTGRRLLAPTMTGRALLADAIVDMCRRFRLSSAHINFLGEDEAAELEAQGLLMRTDQQFHWLNRGYSSFDDFLASLASRKRKMIRRERAQAADGLDIRQISSGDLTQRHWDAFFRFYQDTGGRKWGSPYLNRDFFALLHERMADRVLLIMAYEDGRPIAGALNMIGSDALYGRYWGRTVDRPFLHFEICYYQAMDYAIRHGFTRLEAGAQGEHKLTRGYEPALTRSAHWITHAGLRGAVADYLQRERAYVAENMTGLAAYTPFRKDGGAAAPDDEESF